MTDSKPPIPRVLLVAEHASEKFGGEAQLPLQYFRRLHARDVPVWLVTHARVRDELQQLLPAALYDRVTFVEDGPLHAQLWRAQNALPRRLGEPMFGIPHRLLTQWNARALVKQLVHKHKVTVVHQPIPISPKEPSMLFDLGAPLIIGTLNGGIDLPAFAAHLESATVRRFVPIARTFAHALNVLIPGKLQAELVLVANTRTRRALPVGVKNVLDDGLEMGIDLATYPIAPARKRQAGQLRLVFVGRLIDIKGLQWALLAIAQLRTTHGALDVQLTVCGDGPMRALWQAQASALGLAEKVHFLGWVDAPAVARELEQADAMIHPCIAEAAGNGILEAMARQRPIVAVDWGGPGQLVQDGGFLVAPTSEAALIDGFAVAITQLANDVTGCHAMGIRARAIAEKYDWNARIERFLGYYRDVAR